MYTSETLTASTFEIYNAQVCSSEELQQIVSELAIPYATDFWAGAWKELLKGQDKQFGTMDAQANIYPETQTLMDLNGISTSDASWPIIAWRRAIDNELFDEDGLRVEPFWTEESARKVLEEFIIPQKDGGYGGEIMIMRDQGDIVAFTAYVKALFSNGPQLAQKRFPYSELVIGGQLVSVTLDSLLSQAYPEKSLGIFLDFAVSEKCGGKGLGSELFDARMQRLVSLGAQVIVGRTTFNSPRQALGNYGKRGMVPVAYDKGDQCKAIFVGQVDQLVMRV